MIKLKKGSQAAKDYMAKIRAMRKGVKKAAKKVKRKLSGNPRRETQHKDTKSHNVNIRVLSGDNNISNFTLLQIKRNNETIERLNKVILQNKEKLKLFPYKTPFWKNYFNKKNKEINNYIKTLKKQNIIFKKHI